MCTGEAGSLKGIYPEDEVIGNRPLTEEEKQNALFYGISERDARNYTPRQLEELAYEWAKSQQEHIELGS